MVVLLFCWLVAAVGMAMVVGTLLSLSNHPHWFVRGWDFPRVQILAVCVLCLLLYMFCFSGHWYGWTLVVLLASAALWQSACIFPYTPLASRQVQRAGEAPGNDRLRLLISNVQQENAQYDLWKRVVTEVDPDVILAVEVDFRWQRHLEPLRDRWPYAVCHPQENCYGMMLLSRFELAQVQVRFLVQKDVPSIRARVRLPSGLGLWLYGVHPRPPQPMQDQNVTPRDAELVLVGDEVHQHNEPTIVAGDLNDVAWSTTTRLFQRISRLLDPRRGRGFYNTWNANNPLIRFPLDHIFHSNEFRLVRLRRLPHVGSDHFPVLVDLCYRPRKSEEQPPPEKQDGDRAAVRRRFARQVNEEQEGEEEGKLAPP